MMLTATALVTCLPALVAQSADERDVVHFDKGRSVRGRVVLELEDKIAVRIGSVERWISRDDIDRYQSVARAHREALDLLRQINQRSATELMELAKYCSMAGLEHEEALLYWKVLLLDPRHRDANVALGHREQELRWAVPVEGGWAELSQVDRARATWSTAWQLRSEHFRLRCDSGLETSVDTLFELEYFYLAFMELWQSELQLREITEPIQVYVYRDRDQFPSISGNIGAWFAPDENILYTYLEEGGQPYALFHEATHAVLYNMVGGSRRGAGSLPGWLDEGWAEYMETVVVRDRGGLASLRPGRVHPLHPAAAQAIDKPYALHRVLNFKASDFGASTRQDLKYAQCYLLFAYLADGADKHYRQQFLEYLRAAVAGKGQASTFRKMFRRDLKRIERDYLAG